MEYARSYYNPTIGSKETKNGSNVFLADDDTQIIGTYLNWKTATAGVGTTANTSVPNDSICPAGWRLPVIGSNKSYQSLIVSEYGNNMPTGAASQNQNGAHIYAMSQTLRQAPLSIPFSGHFRFDSGAVYAVANAGNFWFSNSHTTTNSHTFVYANYSLYAPGSNNKGLGYPVRCVAPKSHFFLPSGAPKLRRNIVALRLELVVILVAPTPWNMLVLIIILRLVVKKLKMEVIIF